MQVTCEQCSLSFDRKLSQIKKYPHHFCSKKCSNQSKRINPDDFIGKEFESWKILELADPGKNGITRFWCECNCGFRKIVDARSIIRKSSSRCRKCHYKSKRQYVGDISGTFFWSFLRDARKRKIPVYVDQQDIWDQFLKQDRKCYYTNLPLIWKDRSTKTQGDASIDRLNSDKSIGYTKDNIVICHKSINLMKHTLSKENFIFFCTKVANNFSENGV